MTTKVSRGTVLWPRVSKVAVCPKDTFFLFRVDTEFTRSNLRQNLAKILVWFSGECKGLLDLSWITLELFGGSTADRMGSDSYYWTLQYSHHIHLSMPKLVLSRSFRA